MGTQTHPAFKRLRAQEAFFQVQLPSSLMASQQHHQLASGSMGGVGSSGGGAPAPTSGGTMTESLIESNLPVKWVDVLGEWQALSALLKVIEEEKRAPYR